MASILGRDAELSSIATFLERARSTTCALIIEGAAGIGKTSVWLHALEGAAADGFRILSTSATQAETDLAFVGLGDVLAPVIDDALPSLPPPRRSALEVALLRAEAIGEPPDERAVALAASDVLTLAADRAPVVIAIDDLQWLDDASGRALAFALRRTTGPIGVLATFRIGAGVEPVGIDRAVASEDVVHLAVGPLSPETIQRLINERLGVRLPHPTAVRIADAAGGNPFFALEIARAMSDRSLEGPDETLPIPADVLGLVEDRLSTLSDATRRALLIAAIASRPTEHLVAAATTRSAVDALGEAEAAGVITIDGGSITFRHPLFASGIAASATAADVREAHRLVAGQVEDVEQRARHLALSSIGPDASVARALDDAATHARARAAPGSSAELAELARRLTPADDLDGLRARTVVAAEYHFSAGNAPRAWALLQEAIDAADPGTARAELLFRLATIAWMDVARVETLCRSALEESAPDDADLRSALHEHLAWVAIYRGDLRAAADAAARAVQDIDHVRDPGTSGESRATLGMVRFLQGSVSDDLFDVAEREHDVAADARPGGDATAYTPPKAMHGLLLIWSDELDRAREILEGELAEYERSGRYLFRDEVLSYLAELEWRAGRWDVARRHADEALDIAIESGRTLEMGSDLVYPKALVEAHAGDVDTARELASEGVELSRRNGDELNVHRNRAVLGALELALSNPAGALAHLEPVVEFLRTMDSPEPDVIPFVPDAIEALVAADRLDEAAALLAEHGSRARRQRRPFALATAERCRALVLAAGGDTAGAASAIDEALRLHAAVPSPYDLARTRLVEGEIARRARSKRRSRDALNEALGIFDELGATLWSARARAALDRVGGTAAAPGELTPTERRTADAVAEGKTNREVAAELFISIKTVEANLSRVFHKLGVRSRAELIRLTARNS